MPPTRNVFLRYMPLLVALFLLTPVMARAHVHSTPGGGGGGAGAPADAFVGLDEKLGAKVPLDLVFKDENGTPRKLRELITGPTIIVPVYYRCSNVCSFLQSDLTRVLPALKLKAGSDYRVLSLSIDETETPQLAASNQRMYLAAMQDRFPKEGWHFLTGELASIKGVTDAAGFHFKRQGVEFMHPVACFIVSGDGTIVRYLYGTTFLAKDLTLALVEAGEGKIGYGIKKMVGYCFTFDPAKRSYQFNLLRVTATVIIVCCGSFLAYLILGGRQVKRHQAGGK